MVILISQCKYIKNNQRKKFLQLFFRLIFAFWHTCHYRLFCNTQKELFRQGQNRLREQLFLKKDFLQLEVRRLGCTREGDDIADVLHTRHE